jgi:acetate kinase
MTSPTDEPLIGVINAGSSSLKFSIYAGETRLLAGNIDGFGVRPNATATDAKGDAIAPPEFGHSVPASPSEALPALLPWARQHLGTRKLSSLGHRVVHGGMRHSKPARVTPELLAELEELVPLAPLHEPHNLAPIPRFTAPHLKSNKRLRCLMRFTKRAYGATVFMGYHMSISRRCCLIRRPK